MSTFAAAVLALAAAAPPAASPDRHPGFYAFAPAPEAVCRERVRQSRRAPVQPQRLGELPPAYAIRLAAGEAPPRDAPERRRCFTLQRSK